MNQMYKLWHDCNRDTFSLIYKNLTLSKDELDTKISRVAGNLSGITSVQKREVYVDIEDRLLFFVTILALLKLDASLILLPVEINSEDYIRPDCLCITDNKKNPNSLYITEDLSITLSGPAPLAKQKEENNRNSISFFTSSSTGKAKLIGKKGEHITVELEELVSFLKVTEEDHFLSTTPLYHIYGFLFAFLLPIKVSCKNTITPFFTPATITEQLQKSRVTCFISSPGYYNKLGTPAYLEAFQGNVRCISSSAPLPVEVSKNFYRQGIEILEIYGSTETGGIAYRTSARDQMWQLFSYVSIQKQKVDETELQELHIHSKTISVEYDAQTGYNTGDLVQLGENSFSLQGRNTRFVKIGGKRVDLESVRTKFKEYSKISNESSLYIGEFQEKIFVISEDGFPANSIRMKQELKEYLPAYAVPRIFIQALIPKNRLGKIKKYEIEGMVKQHILASTVGEQKN